jgi:NDP-sugar pyrophosphorylase family protein
MQALVLAAGVGSRLRPYTDDRPKPMLEVGGHPIIAYNLAMLAAAGFNDVVINLHAFPGAIRRYVGSGARWGLRVTYSEEHELLGTAGALWPVHQRFRAGTFAIVFGDNINELDLAPMVKFHEAKNAAATVALYEREDVAQSGVADLLPDGRIARFIEKPTPGETASHWVNAGVVLGSPRFFAAIPPQGPSDIGRDVLPGLIARGEPVYGFQMSGSHWWFDRVEDYERERSHPQLAAMGRRMPP